MNCKSLFFYFYNKKARLQHLFLCSPPKRDFKDAPKILLCCMASCGDVVLASSVLDPILKYYPNAIIGFLHTKEASEILEKQIAVHHRHIAPSWLKPNKSKVYNFLSLLYHSFCVYPRVIQEIKSLSYDISLELHPFFPNSLPLAAKARIPQRIAFISKEYDVWITDKIPFPSTISYLPTLYPLLLKQLQIQAPSLHVCLPFLPKKPHDRIVLHLGTSDPKKEWPLFHWEKLAASLRALGFLLFFTGKGKRENSFIKKIAKPEEDLSSQLDFYAFANVLQGAKALISVDSVSIHLAAAFQVPFVALYLYNETIDLWLPPYTHSRLLLCKNCKPKSPLPSQAHFLQESSAQEVLVHFLSLQGVDL